MTSKKKIKKGPTRAQLVRRLRRLEERIRPDALRQPGDHWYELIEYFDAKRIERFPGPFAAFLLGKLDQAIVVEVPAGTSAEEIEQFTQHIRSCGVTSNVLVVQEGVRFLKLAAVSADMEARLDEAQVRSEEPEELGGDPSAVGSVGSESAGNGLGGGVLADVKDPGGGRDRDEAAPAEGA